jgi:hypothetical protein
LTASELTTLLSVLDQVTAGLATIADRMQPVPSPPPKSRRWPLTLMVASFVLVLAVGLGCVVAARSYAMTAQRSEAATKAAETMRQETEIRCFHEIVGYYLGGVKVLDPACGP